MNASEPAESGATVVIHHRIREGREAEYDHWLNEIGPLCRTYPGHLDYHIIRPIPGLTKNYTVVIRFETCEHLRAWMESSDRQRLLEKAKSLLDEGKYTIRSGLDFWFAPPDEDVKVPVQWKQFLVTWSAIYPLVLLATSLGIPALLKLGVPDNRPLITLPITGAVVFMMVYVVMPRYTRLVQKWLYE